MPNDASGRSTPPSASCVDRLLIGTTLFLLLLAGLGLRISLAPEPGYEFDVHVNQGWAKSALEFGLGASYREQVEGNMLPNYPPLSLTIFAGAGWLYTTFSSPDFAVDTVMARIFIKLPAIIADLLIALLLFGIVRRLAGDWAGVGAAALFLFLPPVIYESAVWGQVDSLYTLFVLATLACCLWRRWALCGACMALALLTKFQSVAFVPLVLFVLMRDPQALLRAAIGGIVATTAVLLPFADTESLNAIRDVYLDSPSTYPQISNRAYNFWWLLFGDAATDLPSTDRLLGAMNYRHVGLLLFGGAYAATLLLLRRALHDRASPYFAQALFLGAASAACAFFLLNAQMHERYLFPFTAVALPLAFTGGGMALLYLAVCGFFLLNLLGILPFTHVDAALYETFPLFDAFVAANLVFLYACLLGIIAARSRRWAASSAAGEVVA